MRTKALVVLAILLVVFSVADIGFAKKDKNVDKKEVTAKIKESHDKVAKVVPEKQSITKSSIPDKAPKSSDTKTRALKNLNSKYLVTDKIQTIKHSPLSGYSGGIVITEDGDMPIPTAVGDYNDPANYIAGGSRYPDNPNLQTVLVTDSVFQKERLDEPTTIALIGQMNELWDSQTSQELFNDQVITTPTNPPFKDGMNEIVFTSIKGKGSTGILGYNMYSSTGVRVYGPDGTPYWKMVDSDVYLNAGKSWTTTMADADRNTVDLGNMLLHEQGHTVGLDDTYNDPIKSQDTAQIMGYYIYSMPKETLGAGDIAGTIKMWGA